MLAFYLPWIAGLAILEMWFPASKRPMPRCLRASRCRRRSSS